MQRNQVLKEKARNHVSRTNQCGQVMSEDQSRLNVETKRQSKERLGKQLCRDEIMQGFVGFIKEHAFGGNHKYV